MALIRCYDILTFLKCQPINQKNGRINDPPFLEVKREMESILLEIGFRRLFAVCQILARFASIGESIRNGIGTEAV